MVKQGISFHSNMKDTVEDFHYGVRQTRSAITAPWTRA